MENRNIFDSLTQYRLKIEKDGKSVVDVPGLLALPGLLMAPKLSIAGLIGAPLLGLKVRLENENGETVDVEGAVRSAAETVRDTAVTAAKTIKEEIDQAWEAVSAEDEKESAEEAKPDEEAQPAGEAAPAEDPETPEEEPPVIRVNPEDSDKA